MADVTPENVVLGFDVGGTNLRVGLIGPDLSLIGAVKTPSRGVFEQSDPMATFCEFLANYLDTRLGSRELVAISGGFPSTVSADRRTVFSTSNIPALTNIPVADALARFGVPVFVDRDVNNLLRDDLYAHSLPRTGVVIGFYLGTGLGCALAVDGRVLIGRHGVAGELGHIPSHGNLKQCGCGNIGCVESVASGRALEEGLGGSCCDATIAEVFVKCGDAPFVTNVLEHAAEALATAINILDPHAVVVGGGVVAMKGFPRLSFEEQVVRFARKPYPAAALTFTYSSRGHHNGVRGAGLAAWEALGTPIAPVEGEKKIVPVGGQKRVVS